MTLGLHDLAPDADVHWELCGHRGAGPGCGVFVFMALPVTALHLVAYNCLEWPPWPILRHLVLAKGIGVVVTPQTAKAAYIACRRAYIGKHPRTKQFVVLGGWKDILRGANAGRNHPASSLVRQIIALLGPDTKVYFADDIPVVGVRLFDIDGIRVSKSSVDCTFGIKCVYRANIDPPTR